MQHTDVILRAGRSNRAPLNFDWYENISLKEKFWRFGLKIHDVFIEWIKIKIKVYFSVSLLNLLWSRVRILYPEDRRVQPYDVTIRKQFQKLDKRVKNNVCALEAGLSSLSHQFLIQTSKHGVSVPSHSDDGSSNRSVGIETVLIGVPIWKVEISMKKMKRIVRKHKKLSLIFSSKFQFFVSMELFSQTQSVCCSRRHRELGGSGVRGSLPS